MRALLPSEAPNGPAIVMHFDYDHDRWHWPEPATEQDRTSFSDHKVVIEVTAETLAAVQAANDTLDEVHACIVQTVVEPDGRLMQQACARFVEDDADDPAEYCDACGWWQEEHPEAGV